MDNDGTGYVRTGARDEEIGERDAVTNLYPFMLAAAGEMSDLYTIYYLLRRNHPAVVDCISEGIVMERGYNPVEQTECEANTAILMSSFVLRFDSTQLVYKKFIRGQGIIPQASSFVLNLSMSIIYRYITSIHLFIVHHRRCRNHCTLLPSTFLRSS